MKKVLFFIFCIPCFARTQNIYTVSNAPGAVANYHSLQEAHNSVPAGSILYVMPSAFSYGDPVFSKKLIVYGTGFMLGQNLEPNTQANTAAVILNSITFKPGSDNSMVEGLQLSFLGNNHTQRFIIDTVSGITISRCMATVPIYGAYSGVNSLFWLSGATNCLIKQCYFKSLGSYMLAPFFRYYYGTTPTFSGIRFNNNIIDIQADNIAQFNMGPDDGGFNPGTTDITFTNNTFIIDIKRTRFANLNYTNNIFVHDIPSEVVDPAGLLLNGANLNNVTNAPNMFAAMGTNSQGVSMDNMFVNSLPGYHSTEQKWLTQDNSFVNTFGVGGVACGAFGGSTPYKLSGIPELPYVYNISVPTHATTPGTLSVHIKAKATN